MTASPDSGIILAMSKLKPSIHTLKVLPCEDYPGKTERSYLMSRVCAHGWSLPAGLERDFFLNPRIDLFDRAKKAGINPSKH